MNPYRDPYGAAVAAIRQRMRSGRLVQGEQLMASELSRDLGLGLTPIREALARLAGEDLVEERRGAGYFARRLDAVDLVELYDLQVAYLAAALPTRRPSRRGSEAAPTAPVTPPAAPDQLEVVEGVFLEFVSASRNQALLRAHLRLADQLAPARRTEPEVLEDDPAEWAGLLALVSDGVSPADFIQAYHARRSQAAPDIIATMRSRGPDRRL